MHHLVNVESVLLVILEVCSNERSHQRTASILNLEITTMPCLLRFF